MKHERKEGEMMKKLVVDTATEALSVALWQQEECVQHVTLTGKKQHGETLVSVVEELLQQQGWQPTDIESLIVGIGPGSYTGLRVGVTMMKVWATAKRLPLMTVSSLSLMAANVTEEGLIVPVMDARRMTAYTGAYRWEQGKLTEVMGDCHTQWDEWLQRLAQVVTPNEKIMFVGSNIQPFVEAAQRVLGAFNSIQEQTAYPNVRLVNQVCQTSVDAPEYLAPNYCHMTLAEQEWAMKQQGQEHDTTLVEHY